MMYWIYLIVASVFETGWPLGLKLASLSAFKVGWISFSVITMILSGVFLYLAQKGISIGTAYAVWTGLGACGTFFIGVFWFNDALTAMRLWGILFILTGVGLLKFG